MKHTPFQEYSPLPLPQYQQPTHLTEHTASGKTNVHTFRRKERRKRNVAAIFKIGRPLVICQRENE